MKNKKNYFLFINKMSEQEKKIEYDKSSQNKESTKDNENSENINNSKDKKEEIKILIQKIMY